jgi:hypothetical protein
MLFIFNLKYNDASESLNIKVVLLSVHVHTVHKNKCTITAARHVVYFLTQRIWD